MPERNMDEIMLDVENTNAYIKERKNYYANDLENFVSSLVGALETISIAKVNVKWSENAVCSAEGGRYTAQFICSSKFDVSVETKDKRGAWDFECLFRKKYVPSDWKDNYWGILIHPSNIYLNVYSTDGTENVKRLERWARDKRLVIGFDYQYKRSSAPIVDISDVISAYRWTGQDAVMEVHVDDIYYELPPNSKESGLSVFEEVINNYLIASTNILSGK